MDKESLEARIKEIDDLVQKIGIQLLQQNPTYNQLMGEKETLTKWLASLEEEPEE